MCQSLTATATADSLPAPQGVDVQGHTMRTRILDAQTALVDTLAAEAAAVLAEGGVIALPTDTVYGLAARADNDAAMRALFDVKGRRDDHPIPILLPAAEDLPRAAREVPPDALRLAARFWPGPLTIVLPKAPAVSDLVTGGKPRVGLRVPDHPVALAVLGACEFLVAVTSANLSGLPPARDAAQVAREFGGRVALIVAAGECPGGVPSTVVEVGERGLRVVRAGALSVEELQEALW